MPPNFFDKISEMLREIYMPLIRERLNNSNVLLKHLGQIDSEISLEGKSLMFPLRYHSNS